MCSKATSAAMMFQIDTVELAIKLPMPPHATRAPPCCQSKRRPLPVGIGRRVRSERFARFGSLLACALVSVPDGGVGTVA